MLINWFTVAAQIVNFFILVWLLKRFLYVPVLRAIDEREGKIKKQLTEAAQQKAEAEKERQTFREKNTEFDRERNTQMQKALNSVQQERSNLMEQARREYETLRSKLEDSLHEEQDSINRELTNLAQREVFSMAAKTLRDLASASLEDQIVRVFLEKLSTLSPQDTKQLKDAVDAGGAALIRTAFPLGAEQNHIIKQAMEKIGCSGAGIQFAVAPQLITGIELRAGGFKLAWNIADYVRDMSASIDAYVQGKSRTAKTTVR